MIIAFYRKAHSSLGGFDMKKALASLLCILLGISLMACGAKTIQSSSNEKTPSEQAEMTEKTTTVSLSLDPEKIASYPLNADETDSPFSLTGYIGYIEMGYYPQTIAHHRAVAAMSQTTDSTGYYFSTWDNEHYAKIVKAKVFGKRFKFSEDSLITENETYYFKVEPIKWWVFLSGDSASTDSDKKITLISELILDSSAFCSDYSQNIATLEYFRDDHPDEVYANNWGYSDLRGWLNNEFMKKAFSVAEERRLLERNTSSVSSPYDAESATEKIWVPSAVEMRAYQRLYSALNLSMRNHYVQMTALVSDYARCRNTFMSIYPDFYGCGRYWTTSAGNTTYRVSYVPCDYHDDGGNGESVGSSFMGVRPVICMYASDVTPILQDVEEE